MRKKLLTIISILLVVNSIILGFDMISHNNVVKAKPKREIVKVEKKDDKIDIEKLQKTYNNTDIIAYLEIPNVFGTPVVQTSDNDYYLNKDLYKNYDIKGSEFLDFRNTLDDRKLLIYGHSGKEKELPFLQLNNYISEDYYKEHKYIYLYTMNDVRKYLIFSSYIEDKDYDYVNLKSFSGLTWKEHLLKLKNKSNYNIDVNLDDDSKIIILQTCSMNDEASGKYHLVIGLEIR